jgi:hypothetical protein
MKLPSIKRIVEKLTPDLDIPSAELVPVPVATES